jgi:uncharacterized protein YprB with RNaseH-like and TPR domain
LNLRDRLERLRREPPPGLDALPALEREVIGESGDGLSLKQRLERLVGAATSPAPRRPRPALEAVAPGRVVSTGRGEFYMLEHALHLDCFHGDVPLARLRALPPESLEILMGEPAFAGLDAARTVFLDTETTGLAGGAGTAAFLIGTGFLDGDRFVVRQYFMRDYNEEAAMLEALAQALLGFEHVVTYNGKMFDLPLLEARFRLNRVRFPLAAASHLDLLHPARRLWKLRLESCRLQSLESALLGVSRRGDIPGEEIPRAYFRYVRSRDPAAVGRIFEHNRVDIVSLAALLTLACQWIDEARAEDARDVFSLARVLERAQRYERSQTEYRRALRLDPGPLRAPALMRLAAHAKRDGDASGAALLWEEAAREGDCAAFRELAVHHERRRRDASAALRVVEAALFALAGRERPCCRRASREFERRRLRLHARQRRAAAAQASLR